MDLEADKEGDGFVLITNVVTLQRVLDLAVAKLVRVNVTLHV